MNSRIIKIAHIVAIGLCLLACAIAFGEQTGNGSQANNNGNANMGGSVSNYDRQAMMALGVSGIKEVELSRIAAERASTDAIKQFAQRMVDDHTKANQELMQLASSKGVTLPSTPDARLQAMITRLGQLTGREFDRTYMKLAGVNEHRKVVRLLQRVSVNASDADLRAFAARTLPIVQEHLSMAESIGGVRHGGGANANANPNANMSGANGNGNMPMHR